MTLLSPITTAQDPELGPESIARLEDRALFVRTETVRLIAIAKTGHYASSFSCAEIFSALYYDVMNLRAGEPGWADRDRFLMGKGHAAVGLYPILADWGFFDPSVLDEYTRLGNPLGDHPDMTQVPGVDFSSGSLGHALSVGVGMQHAARVQEQDFHTFVLLGDGELQEGQVWEAALNAAHYKLRNLVAIVDRNQYSLDGKVDDVMGIEPVTDKWRAFGWNCIEVDGHDVKAVTEVLRAVKSDPDEQRPTVVIAHTVKGKGIEYMESEVGWHLGWLDTEDEKDAYAELAGGLK
jgi:transketolase